MDSIAFHEVSSCTVVPGRVERRPLDDVHIRRVC